MFKKCAKCKKIFLRFFVKERTLDLKEIGVPIISKDIFCIWCAKSINNYFKRNGHKNPSSSNASH